MSKTIDTTGATAVDSKLAAKRAHQAAYARAKRESKKTGEPVQAIMARFKAGAAPVSEPVIETMPAYTEIQVVEAAEEPGSDGSVTRATDDFLDEQCSTEQLRAFAEPSAPSPEEEEKEEEEESVPAFEALDSFEPSKLAKPAYTARGPGRPRKEAQPDLTSAQAKQLLQFFHKVRAAGVVPVARNEIGQHLDFWASREKCKYIGGLAYTDQARRQAATSGKLYIQYGALVGDNIGKVRETIETVAKAQGYEVDYDSQGLFLTV